MNQDNQIESEIQAKGKTAARVTPADIEANIAIQFYFTGADGAAMAQIASMSASSEDDIQDEIRVDERLALITICVLITTNGTKLVGVNEGPVSPENFDAEMGRNMARQKAIDQLWPMLGYELRTKLQG